MKGSRSLKIIDSRQFGIIQSHAFLKVNTLLQYLTTGKFIDKLLKISELVRLSNGGCRFKNSGSIKSNRVAKGPPLF